MKKQGVIRIGLSQALVVLVACGLLFIIASVGTADPYYPPNEYHVSLHGQWNLITVPVNTSITQDQIIVRNNSIDYSFSEAISQGIILGTVFGWNRVAQEYFLVSGSLLEPGFGYWVWANYPCLFMVLSDVRGDGYITSVRTGWNIMGQTYNTSVSLMDLSVLYNGSEYSWADAISSNNEEGTPLILSTIFKWNGGIQQYEQITMLTPGDGNWLYAFYDCSIRQEIDPPVIVDNSEDSVGTGDSFIINASVSDADGVSSVWLRYWYGSEPFVFVEMSPTGVSDFYETVLMIPSDSINPLWYIIAANDTMNHWSTTIEKTVIVYDDDAPVIENVSVSPSSVLQGGSVNVSCDVFDNIMVDEVRLVLIYPDLSTENLSMNRIEDQFYLNQSYMMVGVHEFFIWVNDTSANMNMTTSSTFEVLAAVSLDTSLDSVTPYIQYSLPLSLTATGDSRLDNVTLYYRYSDDNSSFFPQGLLTPEVLYFNSTTVSSNTAVWNHPYYNSGEGDLIIITVSTRGGTAPSSITYGGIPLTVLVEQQAPSLPHDNWPGVAIYALRKTDFPSIGNHNLVFNTTADPTTGATSFYMLRNVSQDLQSVITGSTYVTSGSSISTSINPINASIIIDAVTFRDGAAASPAVGQIQSFKAIFESPRLAGSSYKLAESGANSMSWVNGNTNRIRQVVIAINATWKLDPPPAWQPWVNESNPDTSAPWSWDFNFPNGTGYYEFHSIGAKDQSYETIKTAAETRCRYLLPDLNTSLIPISPYVQISSPLQLNAIGYAGLDNVTLFYRYSNDNDTWGSPVNPLNFGRDSYPGGGTQRTISSYAYAMEYEATKTGYVYNITWYLHKTSGTTNFKVAIYDASKNLLQQGVRSGVGSAGWYTTELNSPVFVTEGQKYWLAGRAESATTYCYHGVTSNENAISPTLTYDVFPLQTLSGTAYTDRSFYVYATIYERDPYPFIIWDNASNPDVSAPWSWDFDFPNGEGYYEFFSIGAKDASYESAPTSADAICSYGDFVAPSIFLNFAGNPGDVGGPYYLPGTDIPAPAGYYTNDSFQEENWIYINCTVMDNVGVDSVWLHWLNGTQWTNNTYQFIHTGGNYYEINMSADVAAGNKYSFDVVAVDAAGNAAVHQWLKIGVRTTAVNVRRYVQLAGTPTNISYTPYYFYPAPYYYTTGYGSGHSMTNDDILHHDQGPDGTLTDTGYLLGPLPTDEVQLRYCTMYVGYWFDETVTAAPDTLRNIYHRFWWHTDNHNLTVAYGKTQAGLYRTQSWGQSYNTNITNAHSNISYEGLTYHLESALMDISSPQSFSDNDIYEFFVTYYSGTNTNPFVINNRSFLSYVIFNVPDNATLQSLDTDGDGLSDYEELFVTFTSPFLQDTDNDGYSDYVEYLAGSDPNNYLSKPTLHDLTIDSTIGGSVIAPGEDVFTYVYGSLVDLEAIADEFYHFVEWTGDNETIDDVSSNITTIEILGNYTITAVFMPLNQPPTHDTPLLVSEQGTNTTYESLLCFNQSTSDPEGDAVTNTYNWVRNGTSLTNLSLSFNLNSTSTVKDYSGAENDGTIHGATWVSNGVVGGAYDFDGVDDYIVIPHSPSLDGNGSWSGLTVEYWLYLNSDQVSKTIVAKYAGTGPNQRSYLMYISSNTNRLFGAVTRQGNLHITAGGTSTTLNQQQWYHVVMTYEVGVGLRVYLNGQLNATNTISTGNIQATPDVDVYIGCRYGTEAFLDGMLDEVKIYPFALTAEQIQQNYLDMRDGLSNVSTIVKEETTVGDVWQCDVTPSDGQQDGETKSSNLLTIIPVYELTITTNGTGYGGVECHPSGPYQPNEMVTLWANASEYSMFTGWSGDLNGTTTPQTLIMDADKTVNAEFTALNQPPTHAPPLLISEQGTNTTYESLLCFNQSTSDPDGDVVINTYNWLTNGVSLTNLSLSFNTNSSDLVKDYSGYGNHGTIHGATWTDDGQVGGAYSFDGVDDYIRIPDNVSLDGGGAWSEFSLEYWMYLNTNQVSKKILSKYYSTGANQRSYMMYISSTTNKLFVYLYFQDGSSTYQNFTTIPNAQQWYHVAMTYKSGEGIKLYLNGELDEEKPAVSGYLQKSPGYDLFLGCRYDSVGAREFFDGKLDEVKIYPFALTPQQIMQNYNDSKDGVSNVSTIVKEETNIGDIWQCNVTPSDGQHDGITKASNPLTIVPVYTLMVTQSGSGSGTVEKHPSGPSYPSGTLVTLWANASVGSDFIGWSGDLAGDISPETLLMNSDKSVNAEFSSTTQLTLNASYDSGSIQSYSIDGNTINLALKTEHLINSGQYYTYWMNVKLHNTLEKNLTFHITNADQVPFLTNTTYPVHLVYSYDGIQWDRLTNYSYSEGTYSFWQNFTENEVQIATFFPFSYTDMQQYLQTVNTSQWATTTTIGTSTEHRNIDVLTITNPTIPDANKNVIYIIGRQHPAETASSHMLKGLIDYLIDDTGEARHLRDSFLWYIIPMVNPDGVYVGNTRGNSTTTNNIDINREWDSVVSTEINLIKNHLTTIHTTTGIDVFIDWHSQITDISWYNYVYAPPTTDQFYNEGKHFASLLAKHTDFDNHTNPGLGSSSARGYATNLGILTFTFEPTPHLHTWTIESLQQQGVKTASAIDEFFPLLMDSEFNDSVDSTDLIAKNNELGWYESRNNDPRLVSLDANNIAGNTGKKAAFLTDDITNFVYLTQAFRTPQTGRISVSLDIYIDKISEYVVVDQNYFYNRTGMLFIGTDADGINGPCSASSERFIMLAFYDKTPADFGDTITLMARETVSQSWYRTHEWTPLATNLSYDTWYTMHLDIDFMNRNYAISINDVLLNDNVSGYSGYTPSVLTDISFYAGGTGRGDFYVDNVFSPAHQRKRLQTSTQGNGTIHISPSDSSYEPATTITLTAQAEPGWSFHNWEGDLTGSTNPAEFPILSHMNITAVFTQDEYYITLQQQGSGTITLNPDNPTYHYGESIQITAEPNMGSNFTHWTDDITGYTNPTTFIITANTTITAHFSATASKKLTTQVNGGGSILTNPARAMYEPDTTVDLEAIGNQGWTFYQWTGDVPGGSSNQTNITIIMDSNKTLTAYFNNSLPVVETLSAFNITATSVTLQGDLIDTSGESCTVWFEYDDYEFINCMGTIATGTVCKDGRSIIHKNRHYGVNNQKPRFYQGSNYSYFGIGHAEGMIRMGQNEKGLALVNMDVGGTITNWQYTTDWASGSEDNDFHNTLGQFSTVSEAAYYLAFHGNYGKGANEVYGQYLIISSEPGVGAIVSIDKVGHTAISWINNTYAGVSAGAWYCDGKTNAWSRRATAIMKDIVDNHNSSDGDNLLNWKDIAQRVAKDTYGREQGTGSYYYNDAISKTTSRATTVHVGGDASFNSSVHMSWVNFGETTQIGIFLPIYAGNLSSTADIPSNFTSDNNGLGIHPYVNVKRLYAQGNLNYGYFYAERVREIQHYAEYNENITFTAFDNLMNTIMYAANEQEVKDKLSDFAHTITPRALKGYISNITSQSIDTSKLFPKDEGIFTKIANGLQPGTIYYYQAWANNTAGMNNGTQQMFLTRPKIPTNIVLQRTQPTEVSLSWTKGTGSHFTIIERNATNVPAWDRGAGILVYNGTGLSCTDTDLVPGVEYYYQLWSYTIDRGLQQYSSDFVSGYTGSVPPQHLLIDSLFDESASSAELRSNANGGWYESRNSPPSELLILDTTNVAGNVGKKAKLLQSTEQSAYLSQKFSTPQEGNFTVQWDIYIDSIMDIAAPDRTGWMLIGDDSLPGSGPNAVEAERFVYMAFYKPGGGTTGTMDLIAINRTGGWDNMQIIARDLNLKQWYTIRVDLNIQADCYDIFINGEYQNTTTSKTAKTNVTHISFAQWNNGAGTFYVDNVFSYIPGTISTAPLIFDEQPPQDSTNVPVSTSELSVIIADPQDILLNYTIETKPAIGSSSQSNVTGGLKTCVLNTSLNYGTIYTWYVNVTNGMQWTNKTYTFVTELPAGNDPPLITNNIPAHNAVQVPVNLTELSVHLSDPEEGLLNWTIQTSPNIGSTSGFNESSGQKTCVISDLSYSTIYTWYVNVSDGATWTRAVFSFKVEDDGLLVDNEFDDSVDSADLLANNPLIRDWYESRGHTPTLISLDNSDIGGNSGKKAAFKGHNDTKFAYLSQEFNDPQNNIFSLSIDMYIDNVSDYSTYDRTGTIFIGDDFDGSNGPCSVSAERFLVLAFYDPTPPGSSGNDLELRAKNGSQPFGTTSSWTTIAQNLSYKKWYTIYLEVNPTEGTYDVYLNGTLKATNVNKNSDYLRNSVTHVSFYVGGYSRGDFYVDNVYAIPIEINNPPQINNEIPVTLSTDVSMSISELSVDINDINGDLINYSIETFPYIGHQDNLSAPGEAGGTKTCAIANLEYNTLYTWYVNATDGVEWTRDVFTFTTESEAANTPPAVSDPDPPNDATDVLLTISQLSISLYDAESDPLDWTITTSPAIGSNASSSDISGTKTCSISGLNPATTYTWFVNVTDGTAWTQKTFTFTTEPLPNVAPTHDNPLLESEFGTNTTDENLLCYNQSTFDANGDQVYNTYHWLRNGVSLTNLLLPFNTQHSSTVTDHSGYNNHGTISGATWTNTGRIGGAYAFDGVDDYITIPHSTTLDGDGGWSEMTVEYWLYLSSNQVSKTIIGKYGGLLENQRSYLMYISSNQNRLFGAVTRVGGSHITAGNVDTTLTSHTWHHVVMTYKVGVGLRVYLNAQLKANNTASTGNIQASPDVNLIIGCRYGTEAFFNGIIDEVKIYPFALTEEQVIQNYNESKDGYSNISTIVKQQTSSGDTWQCAVTPSDLQLDGIKKFSNILQIQ